MSITLEPGRLALRKPQLGGLLMVEVRDPFGSTFYADVNSENTESGCECMMMEDFLPVLRPGDMVPTGSLLYEIRCTGICPVECHNEYTASSAFMVALLRYGPDDATGGEPPTCPVHHGGKTSGCICRITSDTPTNESSP